MSIPTDDPTLEAPTIRAALASDAAAVETLLQALSLPPDGVRDHLPSFVVAVDEEQLVGTIGLELHGDDALLRSAAVAKEWQGRGLGRMLTERIVGEAVVRGVKSLYLLTTSADRYFATFGFEPASRETVPGLLKRSAQFQGACPETALLMKLQLDDPFG